MQYFLDRECSAVCSPWIRETERREGIVGIWFELKRGQDSGVSVSLVTCTTDDNDVVLKSNLASAFWKAGGLRNAAGEGKKEGRAAAALLNIRENEGKREEKKLCDLTHLEFYLSTGRDLLILLCQSTREKNQRKELYGCR